MVQSVSFLCFSSPSFTFLFLIRIVEEGIYGNAKDEAKEKEEDEGIETLRRMNEDELGSLADERSMLFSNLMKANKVYHNIGMK